MRFNLFSKMKPSGVDYLDDIPEHWSLIRVKYAAPFAYGDALASDSRDIDGNVPVYGSNGIVGYHSLANTSAPCLIVGRKGSFGKINYSNVPCFAIDTTFYVDERTANVNLRWLYYALQPLRLDSYSQDSAVPGLSREFTHNQWLPNIPIAEQQAIAAFLDQEIAVINTLIAKKRELIERLQEKRTALISHAITKGLDPTVPMRDSGIEWSGGEMPTHWTAQKLWTVAYLQRGHDLTTDERCPGNVPVYSSSGLSGYHDTVMANAPGVVTGRYGSIGKVFYTEDNYWPMNTALYVRNFWNNHPRFIYYLLQTLPFDAFSGKSAVPGIDRNDLHRLKVRRPPIEEQKAITEFLDHQMEQLDKVSARIHKVIERLQEYRTALISATVTGKIDLRSHVQGGS